MFIDSSALWLYDRVMGTMGISCGWVHFLSIDLKCLQTSNYSSRNSLHTDEESGKKEGCNMLSCRWMTEQLKWKRTWPLPLCFPNVCLNHNRLLCGACAGVTRPIQQMDGRTETRRPWSEWLIGVWKCLLASTACRTLCSEEKNKSLPRQ